LNQRSDLERLAQEAGAVDVLVSNAGIPASGPLTSFSLDQIDNAISVNLRAGIMLARLLVPAMVERGAGHIVFMASMSGHLPAPKNSLYNAGKFGLRGFAQALRMELRGAGVGVSLVSPTYVSEAGMWAEGGGRAPAIFQVTPVDVADAVVKAIKGNRLEVMVAKLPVRAAARLQGLAPVVGESILSRAVEHGDEVVERQRVKR